MDKIAKYVKVNDSAADFINSITLVEGEQKIFNAFGNTAGSIYTVTMPDDGNQDGLLLQGGVPWLPLRQKYVPLMVSGFPPKYYIIMSHDKLKRTFESISGPNIIRKYSKKVLQKQQITTRFDAVVSQMHDSLIQSATNGIKEYCHSRLKCMNSQP